MSLDALLALGAVEHAPFGARTTYRVGGTVRVFFAPASLGDLDGLTPAWAECGLPLYVLGNGSNLLVAEGEHDVLGLHLRDGFSDLEWHDADGRVVVRAGAGLDLPVAARRLAAEGIVGFEWAVGVPGTFGGAVVMNAGGHGSDMAATVREVTTWSEGTTRHWVSDELAFAYRTSALGATDVVTSVTLHLTRGDAAAAKAQISEIVRWRREHQPGGANAGSVFRNPEGDHAGRLIEAAGCRGLRHGSAVVSEKHANFILVDTDGRADDVYQLLCTVRERVREQSGVRLQVEHRLLGFGGEQ
jgi:UDP-N-acetylmuramate dehydrogenase